MVRKKKQSRMTEFHTVKRIDNSRIVRHVEPVKMRRLYRTVAIGGMIAASAIAIFLIPVTFYVIERLFAGRKEKPPAAAIAKAPPKPEPAIN